MYLNIAEAASRPGDDRRSRFRCALGEASEAAAAIQPVTVLKVMSPQLLADQHHRLSRIAAMLNRLAKSTR